MNQKKWILAGVIMIAVVFVLIGISEWKKKYIPQPKQITQTADQSTKTDEIESVKDLIDGEYVLHRLIRPIGGYIRMRQSVLK
jgi:hypothetical protein